MSVVRFAATGLIIQEIDILLVNLMRKRFHDFNRGRLYNLKIHVLDLGCCWLLYPSSALDKSAMLDFRFAGLFGWWIEQQHRGGNDIPR